MSDLNQFIKSYWEYFLELEAQLFETKRFVAFDTANAKAYSIEYLKLYQAVCSEIDVVGKEIAVAINPNFKIDYKTNIQKWGYEIQQAFPMIKDTKICFNDDLIIQPYENWEYEKHTTTDKNGIKKTKLRIKDKKNAIIWWRNYNSIKHRRIGLLEGTKNFQLANQNNLIQAYSALFLLETLYVTSFSEFNDSYIGKSKLFKIVQKTVSD